LAEPAPKPPLPHQRPEGGAGIECRGQRHRFSLAQYATRGHYLAGNCGGYLERRTVGVSAE
jgi:hypothetical protein